jgi:voltage-gated potassium channel
MPIQIIAINFAIIIVLGGYCLKLSEGVLFLYNAGYTTGFENYANCFWSIFITMATVGYGDFFPKTTPGRIIIMFIAIFGVLLSSLLIVSLNLYLNMAPNETKSHVIITRLQ